MIKKFIINYIFIILFSLFLYSQNKNTINLIKEWAYKIEETLNHGDISYFNNSIDNNTFYKITFKNISGNMKKHFWKGFMESFNLGKIIINQIKNGGSYSFVKIKYKKKRNKVNYFIIFRLLTREGLNYHKFSLFLKNNTEVKIKNIYFYTSGEWLSKTIRRIYLLTFPNSFFKKLFRIEGELLKNSNKINELNLYVKIGNYKKALECYYSLPESLQKEKIFLLQRIKCSMKLSNIKEYNKAIKYYLENYPNDISLNILLINYNIINKKYNQAKKYILNLLKKVRDPYLYSYLGQVYYLKGDNKKALKYFWKAIKKKRNLKESYFNFLDFALATKKFKLIKKLLLKLEKNVKEKLNIVEVVNNNKIFEKFRKSKYYKEWLEERNKLKK